MTTNRDKSPDGLIDTRPPAPPKPAWKWFAQRWPAWLTRGKAAILGLSLVLLVGSLAWLGFDVIRSHWSTRIDSTDGGTIPGEIRRFLEKRGFRPAEGTKITENGWPTAIAQSSGEPRTLALHGSLYLPEGIRAGIGREPSTVCLAF